MIVATPGVGHGLAPARELRNLDSLRREELLEHVAGQTRRRVERGQAEHRNGQDEQRVRDVGGTGKTRNHAEHLRQAGGEDLRGRRVGTVHVSREHEGDGAQRDDRDQALEKHAAIGNRLRLAFPVKLLGRRAGGDEAMETRDGAACDGDEERREEKAACSHL